MKSSIRTSMYQAVSFLIILPVLLLSLILSYIYALKLETVIVDSLHAVAASHIAEMESLCERQKNNLEIIGEMDLSKAALRGELSSENLQYLNNMLHSRVQVIDYLKNIAIIDMNNYVVACSADEYETVARKGISTLYDAMKGDSFWMTDILTVRKNGEEYKAVAALYCVEENSEILGYVLAEIDLSFYDKIRRQAELWNESTFYLLDGRQRIIIAGTAEENRDIFVTTAEQRKDYTDKYNAIDFETYPQGNFQYEVNGKSYITYYSDTKYTNWRMLLTVNLDNYMEQCANYAVTACVLVLFCVVLSFWIGRFASKRIIMPIKNVIDTLSDIQRTQDYSLRVKVVGKDELSSLSNGINRLLVLIENEYHYQVQQQHLLRKKADYDSLTKVMNREKIMRHFDEVIERHKSSKGSFAVLFVDIDDFKSFNTNYGHVIGDHVLLFIASLLERETGGTVGRMGGDEFLVIVESPEYLQILESSLERVNQMAEKQFVIGDSKQQAPITVCIGAAQVDFSSVGSEELTIEQLLKLADSAMYEAKNNGKRGYVIYNTNEIMMNSN